MVSMKVIVAGPRNYFNRLQVNHAMISSGFDITELVSGHQDGVDKLAESLARDSNIPVKPFPPDWGTYGLAAGPIRNRQMARYADALIAIYKKPHGTKGTKNMIKEARFHGLEIYIHYVR